MSLLVRYYKMYCVKDHERVRQRELYEDLYKTLTEAYDKADREAKSSNIIN